MARIDWENLTISGKEFVYVISALFAGSGFCYKIYYTDVESKKQQVTQDSANRDMFQKIGTKLNLHDDQIRELQDNELKRKTIEEYSNESSNGYVPLKRK